MSFDLPALTQAVTHHGAVARILVAATAGSAPREAGTSMLVWREGQSGTIGGGRLELDAAAAARALLADPDARGSALRRYPLGPMLGQCCGGSVSLLTERFGPAELAALSAKRQAGCLVRPIGSAPAEMPLALHRALAGTRNGSCPAHLTLVDGWIIEPLHRPRHALWVHGAGHVGRAVVGIMAPLADWAITWCDMDAARFPSDVPAGVIPLPGDMVARIATLAPPDAHHLILTYSHALDLELCHALLGHGFASAGLIGSRTKWFRFRQRLRQLGHSDAAIARITCPIGDPALGKAPQAIAIGAAALLLRAATASSEMSMDRPA